MAGRWRCGGEEGAAGCGTRDRARAWILLRPAMFSGTVLAAYALAPTAGRTRLEATVIRRAKLRKVHALLERRGLLAMLAARLMPGVPAAGPSLRRRRRSRRGACARRDPDCRSIDRGRCGDGRGPGATPPNPLPPPELRLSLPEIEGGGRAVARPPPQPGDLRYIAGAAA